MQSINASGHKYGLVYPGSGWVVWRNPEALPDDLVFKVNYLGGEMPTFSLNFSRPGNQVVAQYYNFIRLGFDGYRRVQQAARDVAEAVPREGRARSAPFDLITDGTGLPVFAFAMKPEFTTTRCSTSPACSGRRAGSSAYRFPANREDLAALRVS